MFQKKAFGKKVLSFMQGFKSANLTICKFGNLAKMALFYPFKKSRFCFGQNTLAKNEIIYPKNVRAKVAMDFT